MLINFGYQKRIFNYIEPLSQEKDQIKHKGNNDSIIIGIIIINI